MAELKFGPTTVDLTTLSTHHQVTTVSTCGIRWAALQFGHP